MGHRVYLLEYISDRECLKEAWYKLKTVCLLSESRGVKKRKKNRFQSGKKEGETEKEMTGREKSVCRVRESSPIGD